MQIVTYKPRQSLAGERIKISKIFTEKLTRKASAASEIPRSLNQGEFGNLSCEATTTSAAKRKNNEARRSEIWQRARTTERRRRCLLLFDELGERKKGIIKFPPLSLFVARWRKLFHNKQINKPQFY